MPYGDAPGTASQIQVPFETVGPTVVLRCRRRCDLQPRSARVVFPDNRLSGEEVSAAYFGGLDLSTDRPAA